MKVLCIGTLLIEEFCSSLLRKFRICHYIKARSANLCLVFLISNHVFVFVYHQPNISVPEQIPAKTNGDKIKSTSSLKKMDFLLSFYVYAVKLIQTYGLELYLARKVFTKIKSSKSCCIAPLNLCLQKQLSQHLHFLK